MSSRAQRRSSRPALVLLQLLVFVTYIFGPTAAFAEDPTPGPTPVESAAPEVTPDPTTEPTPAPTAEPTQAPTEAPATPAPSEPDPTDAPDPTPAPSDPDPTASPEPDPTTSPDPEPEPGTRPYLITFASGTDEARQLEILASAGVTDESAIPQLSMRSVLLDETSYYDQLTALNAFTEVARIDLDRTRAAEAAPSDTSYADQWSLPQVGWDQLYGTVGIAGSATVAVLDTGVDASHPDLDGVVMFGTSILDGSNGLSDPNGHGTWMAGIVAAETDNGLGIAGTGYAGVSVLPVTVLGADGTGQDSDIIAGVVYAADAGADVILMSFSNPGYSPALQAAIDYAWASGAVLVAATGNDGSDSATFPAGDRGVIGVASTDQADALAGSSNYGAAAFMAAPGDGITTTAIGGGLSTISGTSAAAASVAGAAALLSANEPFLSNSVIVSRLARTADPTLSPGTGNGRLNLARAMADASLEEVQPAGAAPVGDGGPLVGPYLAAANNDAHVAPGWADDSMLAPNIVTFSSLYRVTTGGEVKHVRITLPVGYVIDSDAAIAVPAMAFSSGTWSVAVNPATRRIDASLMTGTGLVVGGWARIDVTARTPLADQDGNAAEWEIRTFVNADASGANNTQQADNPPVLIGETTNPSAVIEVIDAGGNVIANPVLQNGISSTIRVRITQTGSGVKYTDIAVPTCFSSPTGVTTTVSAGGNPYTPAVVTDGFIRIGGGALALDGSLTVQFTTTPNCVSGTYTVASDPSTNASNPPSSTNQSVSTTGGTITVAAGLADLSITKTDSPDPVQTGGTLTYTIGVTNGGPDDASAVKVVDTLPAGTTLVSATGTNWVCTGTTTITCNRTGGNLAPGAAPNITIVVTAPAAAGTISNTATVSSPNDNTPANNSDTETTVVANPADLSITKSDGDDPVNPGQPFDYTIVVTNNGPTAAATVHVDDLVPAAFTVTGTPTTSAGACTATGNDVNCDLALLSATVGSNTWTITIPVTVAGTTEGTHNNTATVSSSTSDPTPANNSDIEPTTIDVLPSITVSKTTDVDSVPETGGPVEFTVTVTNASSEAATIDSLVDSDFGATCLVDAAGVVLAPAGEAGDTYSCTFTRTVSGDFGGDDHSNTVTATASDDDGNTDVEEATATVTFSDVLPSITVSKTTDVDSVPETGGPVEFTVTVTNASSEAATIDSLVDSDFGATCLVDAAGVVLAPAGEAGDTYSCTFTRTVSGDFGGDDHSNTVTATASDDDGNTDVEEATATVTFSDVLPSITVSKTTDVDSVPETGGPVEFTVTVTNASSEAATIDSLVDSDFGATCLVDAAGVVLAPAGEAGDTYSCTFTRTVSGDFGGDDHSNTVTATASDDDGNTDVEEATATVTFSDVLPSITVSKTTDVDSVPETGGPVEFTVTVTNASSEAATIDSLVDSDFGATCLVDAAGVVLAPAGEAGDTYSCTFTRTVSGDFGGDDHSNTVTATASDDDGNTDVEEATATVTFSDVLPSITVSKTTDVDSVPETGGPVEFTVTVTNASSEAATIDSLVDSDFGATCLVDAAGVVLAPAGEAGDTYSCTFTRTVSGDFGGDDHSNTVTATASDDDGNTDVEEATATVTFSDVLPSITVSKTTDVDSVPETGGPVEFTVTVTNASSEAATIDSLVDSDFGATCLVDAAGVVLAPAGEAGDTYSCTFTRTVSGDFGGDDHSNTVTATASDDDGNTDVEEATATVTFSDVLPSITVSKTTDVDSVPETGGPVEFTVTVTNASSEAATIDSLVDSDFGATCLVDAAGVVLAPAGEAGDTYSCTFTRTVSGDFGGDDHSNTVTATASDDDGNTDVEEATATVTFSDVLPSITVSKTTDVDSVPETGGPVEFTVTVTNASSEAATIDSLVDSDFGATCLVDAAGVVLAPAGEAGDTYSCTFTRTVSGDFGGDDHSNTVTATASDDDGNTDVEEATATVTFSDVLPSITVSKTTDVDSVPETGGPVEFTVTVTNASSEAATIDSLVDSDFGATCLVDAAGVVLAPAGEAGDTYSCTFTRTVSGDFGGDDHSNTVTATASDDDGNTDVEEATATVTFSDVLPSITVSKSATPTSRPEPGGIFFYEVSVTNNGLEAAVLTSLVDDSYGNLDARGTCDVPQNLAAGATYTCTFVENFNGTAGASHTNTVAATAGDNDGNTTTGSDDATVRITVASISILTNSAFKIVDDLSPWTISDFEVLLNNKGVVVATNPGQFYYHQRATNSYTETTKWEFTLNWDTDFDTQTGGGQPIHAYIQQSDGTWIDWTSHATNICWPTKAGCPTTPDIGKITVNDVPAGADVWVNVHLDYQLKGTTQNASTFLKTPKTYHFSSSIVAKKQSDGTVLPGGTSFSSGTLLGRGKKVTVIHGTVSDANAVVGPLDDVLVTLKNSSGTVLATYPTTDGFYVFYREMTVSDTNGGTCPACGANGLGMPGGTYKLDFQKTSYVTIVNQSVSVPNDGALKYDKKLTSSP